MTGYPVIPDAQVLQKKPITEEEYCLLMKRRAIPASARDMLDIMLNAVYAKLAPSEIQAPGKIEDHLVIGKEDSFFSKELSCNKLYIQKLKVRWIYISLVSET